MKVFSQIEKNINNFVVKNDPIKESRIWNGLPIAIEWKKAKRENMKDLLTRI